MINKVITTFVTLLSALAIALPALLENMLIGKTTELLI